MLRVSFRGIRDRERAHGKAPRALLGALGALLRGLKQRPLPSDRPLAYLVGGELPSSSESHCMQRRSKSRVEISFGLVNVPMNSPCRETAHVTRSSLDPHFSTRSKLNGCPAYFTDRRRDRMFRSL